MTMGIVEFLEARIAEDEADARAADEGRLLTWSKNDHMVIVDSGFIQTFTPSRVLREVAAKRELLELHYDGNPGPGDIHYCGTCHDYYMHQAEDWPCETVRVLASAFSDHPDFNEEWRP